MKRDAFILAGGIGSPDEIDAAIDDAMAASKEGHHG